MKRVLFNVVLPGVLIAFWLYMIFTFITNLTEFDWLTFWIVSGCPFGIRKMWFWVIPFGHNTATTLIIILMNLIVGGLIGGFVLIFRILKILGEILSITTESITWAVRPE